MHRQGIKWKAGQCVIRIWLEKATAYATIEYGHRYVIYGLYMDTVCACGDNQTLLPATPLTQLLYSPTAGRKPSFLPDTYGDKT